MTIIVEKYIRTHSKSADLAKSAALIFPDGVTHNGRKFNPFPICMDKALGSRKWDIDGNQYIDYRGGHGALILGHSDPRIVRAVSAQMTKGTHLSASSRLEIMWAQLVNKLVPCSEKVRFLNSGTEAVMMSFRMARAYTGKQKIIKFQDGFHGWYDQAVVGTASDNGSSGITDGARNSMIVIPLNDIDALEEILNKDDDIAGVVFQADTIVRPELIQQVKDIANHHKAIFILDEVVSGFRWAKGGFQERFNVVPDLCTLSKILCGGLPGSAVAGKVDIMDTIKPGKVAHPGTFNANPLSATAGAKTLEIIASDPINEIADERADQLKKGICHVLHTMGIDGCAYGISSIVKVRIGIKHECDRTFCILPTGDGPRGITDEVTHLLDVGLINNGIYSRSNAFILSAAHTKDDVDRTVVEYAKTLRDARSLGAL